jgi:hypothetical protein
MLTLPVEPKPNVGKVVAPAGLDVTVAFSTTLPVNPPNGVTVIVDRFPEVAPRGKVSGAPEIVKGRVTTTEPVPVAAL